ncbi:PQQ-binding-like beta-propeller repeat protein [uncultured Jatrophihabitans sp.]|uniref:outer membrane protein assembly factor BamB family protein n=1 Tax=uncultured Jatrophihabitans sp. TaxID=1610747 RepID=UPI0035CC2029
MTDARVGTDAKDTPAAGSSTESAAALGRYRTGLRKQRLVYFSVVGAIVVALVVTVAVAWSRGEVANTTLHTVGKAPSNLAIATPTAGAQRAWSTPDRAALGNPRDGGTVVVWGRHTVRGVDARTGRQTWSYSRSNRTVCAALQSAGTTVAVYRVKGNCDELTALSSGTGNRQWTRTLDQDGQPINGTPSFQMLSYTMLVTTSSFVYAIDPGSGINRWTYGRFGCTIHSAVLGSAGALISQTCTDPRCGALKFCGRGPQLLLRNGTDGVDDKTKNPTNYDKILWNRIGITDVPVSADGVVSALNPSSGSLDLFTADKGRLNGAVTLSPRPGTTGAITSASAAGPEIATVRGVAAVVNGSAGRAVWSRSVTAPLTAVPSVDSADLTLSDAVVTVPTSTGAAVLEGLTGRTVHRITLSPRPASGSSIYPLGSGQLVVGPSGTAAYR